MCLGCNVTHCRRASCILMILLFLTLDRLIVIHCLGILIRACNIFRCFGLRLRQHKFCKAETKVIKL